MKALLHWLLRLFFGFRAFNTDVLRTPGPVLLLPNHVSWIDWLFLGALLDDDWKFVVSSRVAEASWLHRKIMKNSRTFPIDPASPYAVRQMAEHLKKNGRLVLFPEGQITHTGSLMKLYDGTGFLLHKTHAQVITCYLRGLNRFKMSRQPGWRRWFPRVSAHFSAVLHPPEYEGLRTVVARNKSSAWLRDRLVEQQFRAETDLGPTHLLDAIAQMARELPKFTILEDATGQALTYRKLFIGAEVLARKFSALLDQRTERVGVLLPNINATPVVLMSLWGLDKVPAVLNFSTGTPTMLACSQLAGLKEIITSRVFVEKAKLNLKPLEEAGIKLLYLEDVRASVTGTDRLGAALQTFFSPDSLRRVKNSPPDKTAVILFTSGSEGMPKGVELTHANILANLRQILSTMDIEDSDRIFNALPLFHSFGLVVGTLLGLVRGLYIYLYPSPLHYRVVPSVLYDRNCTIFLSTNTFLNGYARRAHPYDFRSMRYLFAAAEKLQEATAQTWMQKYGVRIMEGYGATECAPCVSLITRMEPKLGSVGKIMPGMEYKLEPMEGVADAGRLLVRGPNVMKGYLNADANAKFKELNGWYDTGDIVNVDEDGYFHIRGRLKRFAKVSGEMVSLTAVEDALAGAFPQYGMRCQVAIVTRPDADKGEALIAVSNEPKLQLDEIRAAIKAKGLTNLCVPREIRSVREIPKLGTGKVNHRELQKMIETAERPG